MDQVKCTFKQGCKKPIYSFCFECNNFMCSFHHLKHEPDPEDEEDKAHETLLLEKFIEMIENNNKIEEITKYIEEINKRKEKGKKKILDLLYQKRGNIYYLEKKWNEALNDFERIEEEKEKIKECQREIYRMKQNKIMKDLNWIKEKKVYLRKIYENPLIKELLINFRKYIKLLSIELNDIEKYEKILFRDNFIIYFLGEINVGKSTLINALLGRELMIESVNPSTARKCHILYGNNYIELETMNGKIIKEDINKLKQVQLIENREEMDNIKRIKVYLQDPLLESGIELTDTAGYGELLIKNENKNLMINYNIDQDIQESSAIVYIIHVRSQNIHLLKDLKNQKKFIVANQIDILKNQEKEELLKYLKNMIQSKYSLDINIHGISAKQSLNSKLNGLKIPDEFQLFEQDLFQFIENNFKKETSDLIFKLLNLIQISLDISNSQFEYNLKDEKKKLELIEILKYQAKELKEEYKSVLEKNSEWIQKEIESLIKDKNIMNGIINKLLESPRIKLGIPINKEQEMILIEEFYQLFKYYLDQTLIKRFEGNQTILEKIIKEFIIRVQEKIKKLEEKDTIIDLFCSRYWNKIEQDLEHNYILELKPLEKENTFIEKVLFNTQYLFQLIGIQVHLLVIDQDWIIKNVQDLWNQLDSKLLTREILNQFIQNGFSNLLINQKIYDLSELYNNIFNRVSSSFYEWTFKSKNKLNELELQLSSLYQLLNYGIPKIESENIGKWKDKNVIIQKVTELNNELLNDYYYSRLLYSSEYIYKYEGVVLNENLKDFFFIKENLNSINEEWNHLNYKDQISYSLDIIKAIQYIHHHHFIYRYLNSNCIFIDKLKKKAKLLNLKMNSKDLSFLKYSSPELKNGKAYDQSSDIYSFGILFCQILLKGDLSFLSNLSNIQNPIDQDLKLLLYSCWNNDPKKRPKTIDIIDKLSLILSHLI